MLDVHRIVDESLINQTPHFRMEAQEFLDREGVAVLIWDIGGHRSGNGVDVVPRVL